VRRELGLPQDFALYVGTLEPRKNLSVLIEAVEILRDKIKNFSLVITGRKGWKTGDLSRRVRDLGLEGRVRFTGFIPEGDLPALYHLCRVFVYPSKYEGFGLPPLEAMAAGRPVICSGGSSLPEVVGNAALMVDVGSSEEIARAIQSLWEDEKKRAAMSQAGRERAKEFPWRKAATKIFQLIRLAAS
jgi:glycosyltransferase involved in cell wall biosynthesis